MTPDVTIVVPTRNRLGLLKETIATVRGQTSDRWRLMIVDDASDDDTWAWVGSQIGPTISAIRLETHGERSVARNRGLAEVDTPFVLFLDDDDLLRPHAVETLLADATAGARAHITAGGWVYFYPDGFRHAVLPARWRGTRTVWQQALFGWIPATGSTLFRTVLVREAGAFRAGVSVAEHRDLMLRAARLQQASLIPIPLLDRRMHPGQSRPSNALALEMEVSRQHLEGLSPRERSVGMRIVAAKTSYLAGQDAWEQGHAWRAARAFLGLGRAPVGLLLWLLVHTDLMRPIVRVLLGCILGRGAVRAVLRVESRVRSVRLRRIFR